MEPRDGTPVKLTLSPAGTFDVAHCSAPDKVEVDFGESLTWGVDIVVEGDALRAANQVELEDVSTVFHEVGWRDLGIYGPRRQVLPP